jgi:hypothetical protein
VSRPLRVAGWEVDITHLNPPDGVTGDAMARFARVDLTEEDSEPTLTATQARRLAAALNRKADELCEYKRAAAARVKAARQGALEPGSLWLWHSRETPEVTELRLVRETKRMLRFEFVASGNTVEFHEKEKALSAGLIVPKAAAARGRRRG